MTCASQTRLKQEWVINNLRFIRFIVGVRTVRDQGLHPVHPCDDLDFALNLQCLSQGVHSHTFARVYAVIVTLSARDSDDVSAKNIHVLIIFPLLTSTFHQEPLIKY